MIYWKLIVTKSYQSYEVSCQDINFVPSSMRFSALPKVDTEKIGE